MAVNTMLNTATVPISVPKGGLGVASHVAYTPLTGGTTSTGAVQSVASLGTANNTLQSTGASSLPQFLPSDWQFLVKQQANSVATVSFTGLTTDYIAYKFVFSYLNPATDGVALQCVMSIDNGATYITAASSYSYRYSTITTALTDAVSTGATSILMTTQTGNTAPSEYVAGEITLFYPADSGTYTTLIGQLVNINSSAVDENIVLYGQRLNAEDNDAIQFFFSSGNFASVDITMYGMTRV